MRFTAKLETFRHTLLFIHGFRRNSQSWELEENLSKTNNTLLVDLEEEDYKKSIATVGDEIHTYILHRQIQSVIIVAHSQGSFYALYLAQKDPRLSHKLLLLDPTLKSTVYLEELQAKALGHSSESVEVAKVRYFEDLPTGLEISPSVIIYIHLNVTSNQDFPKIESLSKLTKKNVKSRLMVHWDVSHMLHLRIPGVILDSIRELIKK